MGLETTTGLQEGETVTNRPVQMQLEARHQRCPSRAPITEVRPRQYVSCRIIRRRDKTQTRRLTSAAARDNEETPGGSRVSTATVQHEHIVLDTDDPSEPGQLGVALIQAPSERRSYPISMFAQPDSAALWGEEASGALHL